MSIDQKLQPAKAGRSRKPAASYLTRYQGRMGGGGMKLPEGCPAGSIDEIFQWMAEQAQDVASDTDAQSTATNEG